MKIRIPFLVVLRVHLIVISVQSGGLFEIEDLAPPTPPVTWLSEAVSNADAATESNLRDEALFSPPSASSHA